MTVRLLAGLIVVYAALLRFDAVTLVHGPVETPGWLQSVQQSRPAVSALRPPTMTWERWEGRYISDPYTYLQYAREPRGFYDAHRREPLFVFATRLSLWFFNDQDLAVSWASMAFSVLAVWATFLLGRRAFSPAVGLLASLAMAIEMENITWGVGGWRDDAFTAFVVLTAHALLRLRQVPSALNAAWLGAILAGACLTRITALSFVAPVLALTWWAVPSSAPRRSRLLVTSAVFVILLSPYLINCWRVFGDPMYAINVHADVYRQAEGQAVEASQTARQYLLSTLESRPWRTLDTLLQGMTSYPFLRKWGGFAPWHPALGDGLRVASLIGLALLTTSWNGRVLWLIGGLSLIPYALTWHLIGDWRFTMHVYPLLLLAAATTIVQAATWLRPEAWRGVTFTWHWRQYRWPVSGLAGLCLVLWNIVFVLPRAVAREALAAEGVATVAAGPRDRAFFRDGWGPVKTDGNVTARFTTGSTARLRLPAPANRPYHLMIRMDPFPAPRDGALPHVRFYVDGRPAGRQAMTWDPDRIGAYTVPMPITPHPWVDLQLQVEAQPGAPERLRVWWIQTRAN